MFTRDKQMSALMSALERCPHDGMSALERLVGWDVRLMGCPLDGMSA